MTQGEAVDEVLGLLTGLDLQYGEDVDRYKAVVRALNRALTNNALEHEWSYYSDVENIGKAQAGLQSMHLRSTLRARLIADDSIRLQDCDGNVQMWAYSLPRDALHKYAYREGLWYSVTRTSVDFSRPFNRREQDLDVMIPVMREPRKFRKTVVDPGGGGTPPAQ